MQRLHSPVCERFVLFDALAIAPLNPGTSAFRSTQLLTSIEIGDQWKYWVFQYSTVSLSVDCAAALTVRTASTWWLSRNTIAYNHVGLFCFDWWLWWNEGVSLGWPWVSDWETILKPRLEKSIFLPLLLFGVIVHDSRCFNLNVKHRTLLFSSAGFNLLQFVVHSGHFQTNSVSETTRDSLKGSFLVRP